MTTGEEQQVRTAEERSVGERIAAVEGKQDVLLDVVHENGRRSDQNYRALDAKFDARFDAQEAKFDARFDAQEAKFDARMDAQETRFDAKIDRLDAKIDRLMYFMLGIGGAVLVGIIVGVVSIVLQLSL